VSHPRPDRRPSRSAARGRAEQGRSTTRAAGWAAEPGRGYAGPGQIRACAGHAGRRAGGGCAQQARRRAGDGSALGRYGRRDMERQRRGKNEIEDGRNKMRVF
jgi:hypothetical protein